MKTPMLDYLKMILSKVSFDRRIFRREYKKSFNMLSPTEIRELRHWLKKEGLA